MKTGVRSPSHHLPVSSPTKAALVALGVVELSMGGFALVILIFLFMGFVAEPVSLVWGVLAPLTLLVLAGTGIFVRRPWTYLLHCLVTPVALVGASVVLATVVGPTRGTPIVALTALATGILQLFFLTAEVHRWFDDFWGE